MGGEELLWRKDKRRKCVKMAVMNLLNVRMAACAILSAACAVSSARAGEPRAPDPQIEQGRLIAEKNCSACHAVGVQGASPNPKSPPFRTLSHKYPLSALEEALAEGISVGHPEMPQFEFDPQQADALIAYLRSIQTNAPGKTQ